MCVHAIKFITVQAEKQTAIPNKSWFCNRLGLLMKTNNPTSSANTLTGICE